MLKHKLDLTPAQSSPAASRLSVKAKVFTVAQKALYNLTADIAPSFLVLLPLLQPHCPPCHSLHLTGPPLCRAAALAILSAWNSLCQIPYDFLPLPHHQFFSQMYLLSMKFSDEPT